MTKLALALVALCFAPLAVEAAVLATPAPKPIAAPVESVQVDQAPLPSIAILPAVFEDSAIHLDPIVIHVTKPVSIRGATHIKAEHSRDCDTYRMYSPKSSDTVRICSAR